MTLFRQLFLIIILLHLAGTTKLVSMDTLTLDTFKEWALSYFNVKEQLITNLSKALVTLDASLDKGPVALEEALVDTIADQAYDYKCGTNFIVQALKGPAKLIIKPIIRAKCKEVLGFESITIVKTITPTLQAIKSLDPAQKLQELSKKFQDMFTLTDKDSTIALQKKLHELATKLEALQKQLAKTSSAA